MQNKIANYIKAGYPGLFIVSAEEVRVETEILAAFKRINDGRKKEKQLKLFSWSITTGINSIVEHGQGESEPLGGEETRNPFEMLKAFDDAGERTILLARDFHMMLSDRDPIIYRKLKESLMLAKTRNCVLIIIGCSLVLPAELEKEIAVIEFALPDRDTLGHVLRTVAKDGKAEIAEDIFETFIDAASGMTTQEVENAAALSIVEHREITSAVLQREKEMVIRKNGLLEVIHTSTKLSDIGGLENLKAELESLKHVFTKKAREYGIKSPRGILAVGQAGTGKSLCAQATASIFGLPLLKLEAGRLFGSLVGESEGNWRRAFATVKAIAPCILWIDEPDGLFCGAKSSGATDSGVTNRVIKAIMQDMQYNSEGIFYFLAANDIDGLPDALVDRLDVWGVDLPNLEEREAIIRIHIGKANRDPKKYGTQEIAAALDGFSGRQIEQVWFKAMIDAFNANREPLTKDVLAVSGRFVATSVTMREAIQARRERLKNRAMDASRKPSATATVKAGRKILN